MDTSNISHCTFPCDLKITHNINITATNIILSNLKISQSNCSTLNLTNIDSGENAKTSIGPRERSHTKLT